MVILGFKATHGPIIGGTFSLELFYFILGTQDILGELG